MAGDAFKIGDVVYLKSGSPALTVDDTRKDGALQVVWFDGPVVSRDAFMPQEIVRVPGALVEVILNLNEIE